MTEEDKNDCGNVLFTIIQVNTQEMLYICLLKSWDENIMNTIDGEKVEIPCHYTVSTANISPKKARDLINQLPDDASKTANMEKMLAVKVGVKYIISVNVNIEDGLANVANGKEKFIEYKIEGNNHPSIFWLKFADHRIGRVPREKYFQRGFLIQIFNKTGPQYLKLNEDFCAIAKCTREYNFHCYQLQQK